MMATKYSDVTSPNELRIEYLGINGLCTFPFADSSARSVMFGTQVSQRIVTDKCDRKLQLTGLELRMADSTAKITMPHDGHVLAIIPKFRHAPVAGSIGFNPKTIVIYERADNNHIDYFELPHYGSFDPQFGFRYHPVDHNQNLIRTGAFIPKDTVFSETPSTRDGYFDFGFNTNVAFMSHPAVAEDGFVVSEEFLDERKFHMYEKRAVSFGRTNYPIKVHGEKMYPDIGDYVEKDGLLMTLREFDLDTLVVDMSEAALRHNDFYTDESVYVRAGYRGKVIDIEVYRNNQIDKMPEHFCEQTQKYYKANLLFHRELVDVFHRLRAERRRKYGPQADITLTPKCQSLMTFAVAITEQEEKDAGKVQFIYRKEEIDQWRIVFTIEYEMTPDINFKLSDSHGGNLKCLMHQ